MRMSSRLSAYMRQWLHILIATKRLEDVLFWMAQHELSSQTSHSQLDNESLWIPCHRLSWSLHEDNMVSAPVSTQLLAREHHS